MRANLAIISSILVVISCLCFSCKKGNSSDPSLVKEPVEVIVPIPTKALLAISLQMDKTIVTLKYAQDNGLLTELESTDGTREVYLYTDKNQPNQYNRYIKGEKKYAVYYVRNQAGLVIQANQNTVESNGAVFTPTGNYKIEYDGANQISKVTWYDAHENQLRQSTRTYDPASGPLSKIEEVGQAFTFSYDGKNGWCREIKLPQLLSIESLNNLFLSSAGNITRVIGSGTNSGESANSYVYNADNYPISWVEKDAKGINHNYKVTYK